MAMTGTSDDQRSALPIYFAIIMVSYTATAGITTVYSMLKMLYASFDEPMKIGWVVTGYWLVASACSAICGRIGDIVGRRRMAILMLAIAGIGSLLSAMAPTLTLVIIGCALQGTTGTLTPLTIGLVREAVAREKVPFAVGIITAAGNVGTGISFMAAGWIVDRFSWQGGFTMKVVLVVLAIVALLKLVPPPQQKPGRIPREGLFQGLLFAPAIAGIFISFQLANAWGWQDPRPWSVIAGSLLVLLYWGWDQSHRSHPLIDVRSLGRREILLANLSVGLLAMGCMQNGQAMSLFLQQPQWTGTGFGLSAFQAGIVLLAVGSVSLVASPWGGALGNRHGARAVGSAGAALVLIGWMAITLHHPSLWFVLLADVLMMVGLSVLQTVSYNTVVAATPSDRTSEATGMTYVFLNTSIAIGGQIMFLLMATATVHDPAQGTGTFPADAAYFKAFAYISTIALLGLIVASLLPGRPSGRTH